MTPYVELHCHSNFSLLDGASPVEDLVARAAELGMPALALTDHDALYGAVPFAEVANKHGLQPIFGAELTLEDGHHLTLLVEDAIGWKNLCRLLTLARQNAPKGEAALPSEALAEHTTGLIALSGCRQGEVAARLLAKDWPGALAAADAYQHLFNPDHFFLELQHRLLPDDDRLVSGLVEVARELKLDYVAANNVHYARREASRLQDVLVCIRHLTTLAEAGHLLRPNSETYLKTGEQLAPLFADYPDALTNTLHLADRCRFELPTGLQTLPAFPTPKNIAPIDYLRQLCERKAEVCYPDVPERVRVQLAHELRVIETARLANYFLIVWDIVRFSRQNHIRCQGRGSAANSLVAYLLGISPIDPLAHDLVFERFLSPERQSAPDIDLDFAADRREEVIQYLYRRYGADHAAMACTFITFRARSVVRDVGKVLGLSEQQIRESLIADRLRDSLRGETDEIDPALEQLDDLCRRIDGFPRHLGLHNGGMILTGPPLAEQIPLEPATMPDRVVVQWDKEALENVGIAKIDILGLRMLSAVEEAACLVETETDRKPDLDTLTFNDPAVYDLIARADTLGVFQVESRAQAQMLPRLKPRTFADLIVAISLIRPGPIQGNMVHPYLRRRLGVEPVSYPHHSLKNALEETLGVILFQEQLLKVARDLAGFSPGQGEQLRRALGNKRGSAAIERFREAFLAGSRREGVPQSTAETVFEQLTVFGGYAFAKSHAAAFAVIVYQSAWLKCYHPAALLCALINNQPMGFWTPAVLVGDAQRRGLTIRSLDINRSGEKCALEDGAVRLGLNVVSGLGEVGIERLLVARGEAPFVSLADFCRRTRLPCAMIEKLITTGGMDGWGISRRKLLWQLGQLDFRPDALELPPVDDGVQLPQLTQAAAQGWERAVLGISTGQQVMALYREWLNAQGVLDSQTVRRCSDGEWVRIAGLVVVHQAPPTAKGFHFLTLEDEFGLIDTALQPKVYTRYRTIVRGATLLRVEGLVQREGDVVSILAGALSPLKIAPGADATTNPGW